MKKIAIIVAMDSELKGFVEKMHVFRKVERAGRTFHISKEKGYEVIFVKSGIGKVNAALTTALLLNSFEVDMVVSTGIAGGLEHFPAQSIVVAEKLVQHDFDTTAFGDPKGLIPGFEKAFFESNEKLVRFFFERVSGSKLGTLASGDQFISSKAESEKIRKCFGASACDMESCAIAQVAECFDKPFVAIRSISDSAGDDAESEYSGTVDDLAFEMACKVIAALPGLSEIEL